jgi:hypothetical protein
LITPPPVDEYRLEESDKEKGVHEIRRTAEHTKLYADVIEKSDWSTAWWSQIYGRYLWKKHDGRKATAGLEEG